MDDYFKDLLIDPDLEKDEMIEEKQTEERKIIVNPTKEGH